MFDAAGTTGPHIKLEGGGDRRKGSDATTNATHALTLLRCHICLDCENILGVVGRTSTDTVDPPKVPPLHSTLVVVVVVVVPVRMVVTVVPVVPVVAGGGAGGRCLCGGAFFCRLCHRGRRTGACVAFSGGLHQGSNRWNRRNRRARLGWYWWESMFGWRFASCMSTFSSL
eukprot:s649_g39.t1